MVWVPAAIAVVVSISLTLTPFVSVLLPSTEYPKAVGLRPSHPTLCARTQTGEGTVVPFTGLATVIFAAKAGCDNIIIIPYSVARNNRGVLRPAAWPT